MAVSDSLGLGAGLWNGLMMVNVVAMVIIIVGYGAFQPATYAAVKELSDAKTAPMSYAMLYALQNLGAFVSGLLSPRIPDGHQRRAAPERHQRRVLVLCGPDGDWPGADDSLSATQAAAGRIRAGCPGPQRSQAGRGGVAKAAASASQPGCANIRSPTPSSASLSSVLVPVQTLFAHQWLTLPQYIERAFRPWPWVSENYETFSNLSPLLVFVLTPLLAAATARRSVYSTMIVGTAVMGLPTVLLAFGPSPTALVAFMLIGAMGESLWQPRFLQYAAEIAPPGKTGLYMGVAQLPWFLTKLLTSLYSGWFLAHYCPQQGALHTGQMWLLYWLIACVSPIGLLLGRRWVERSLAGRVIDSSPSEPAT
jgi:POT family proton-dependent oligopeptide transporter